MSHINKHNILYFESLSMRELYNCLEAWQHENQKRFLSISIEREGEKFCCIALTNPSEVVITNERGSAYADVTYDRLDVNSNG